MCVWLGFRVQVTKKVQKNYGTHTNERTNRSWSILGSQHDTCVYIGGGVPTIGMFRQLVVAVLFISAISFATLPTLQEIYSSSFFYSKLPIFFFAPHVTLSHSIWYIYRICVYTCSKRDSTAMLETWAFEGVFYCTHKVVACNDCWYRCQR